MAVCPILPLAAPATTLGRSPLKKLFAMRPQGSRTLLPRVVSGSQSLETEEEES